MKVHGAGESQDPPRALEKSYTYYVVLPFLPLPPYYCQYISCISMISILVILNLNPLCWCYQRILASCLQCFRSGPSEEKAPKAPESLGPTPPPTAPLGAFLPSAESQLGISEDWGGNSHLRGP